MSARRPVDAKLQKLLELACESHYVPMAQLGDKDHDVFMFAVTHGLVDAYVPIARDACNRSGRRAPRKDPRYLWANRHREPPVLHLRSAKCRNDDPHDVHIPNALAPVIAITPKGQRFLSELRMQGTGRKARGRKGGNKPGKVALVIRTMIDNGDVERYGRKWKELLNRHADRLPKGMTADALRKRVERMEQADAR